MLYNTFVIITHELNAYKWHTDCTDCQKVRQKFKKYAHKYILLTRVQI